MIELKYKTVTSITPPSLPRENVLEFCVQMTDHFHSLCLQNCGSSKL